MSKSKLILTEADSLEFSVGAPTVRGATEYDFVKIPKKNPDAIEKIVVRPWRSTNKFYHINSGSAFTIVVVAILTIHSKISCGPCFFKEYLALTANIA